MLGNLDDLRSIYLRPMIPNLAHNMHYPERLSLDRPDRKVRNGRVISCLMKEERTFSSRYSLPDARICARGQEPGSDLG